MKQKFHANGKLLITGEYFILDGAKGLAVPVKYGQSLTVTPILRSEEIHWQSFDNLGQCWIEGKWSVPERKWLNINDETSGKILSDMFYNLEEQGFRINGGLHLTFQLDFPRNWGLGSSSTLISLLSQFTGADPYAILNASLGGSGYDIACATAHCPILYQLNPSGRTIKEVEWKSELQENLYFVHLGKKMNSRIGIQQYKNAGEDKKQWIPELDDVTKKWLECFDFDEMEYLMGVHEAIVSRVLGLEKVKDLLFDDYWGAVKSLGAWGGDFVMVSTDDTRENTEAYFREKGFPVFISYHEMVK